MVKSRPGGQAATVWRTHVDLVFEKDRAGGRVATEWRDRQTSSFGRCFNRSLKKVTMPCGLQTSCGSYIVLHFFNITMWFVSLSISFFAPTSSLSEPLCHCRRTRGLSVHASAQRRTVRIARFHRLPFSALASSCRKRIIKACINLCLDNAVCKTIL